ncbi:MAG: ATP-binding cassette domain-containing protein [Actinomycetota bacterium]|nr:ATP-binding cassette domain-containing protein [Actinomycetota bacterium]
MTAVRPAPAAHRDPAIVLSDLRHVYRTRGRTTLAIESVSLEIRRGEVVSIVGPSGCGKSTLLRLILGLERPTSGTVAVAGADPYADFYDLKRVFGVVFQEDRLLPWRTALANVRLGLEVAGVARRDRDRLAREWLERMELGHCLDAYPHELSGGMRQRVALARAFATGPSIVLADEAFAHLDQAIAVRLRHDFLDLVEASAVTAIVVTHDLPEAVEVGDRVVVLAKPARVAGVLDIDKATADRSSLLPKLQDLVRESVGVTDDDINYGG